MTVVVGGVLVLVAAAISFRLSRWLARETGDVTGIWVVCSPLLFSLPWAWLWEPGEHYALLSGITILNIIMSIAGSEFGLNDWARKQQAAAQTAEPRERLHVEQLHLKTDRKHEAARKRAWELLANHSDLGKRLAMGQEVTVKSKVDPTIDYVIFPDARKSIRVWRGDRGFIGVLCVVPQKPAPNGDTLLAKLLMCQAAEEHLWRIGNFSGASSELPALMAQWQFEVQTIQDLDF